jgi:hypothetical protein
VGFYWCSIIPECYAVRKASTLDRTTLTQCSFHSAQPSTHRAAGLQCRAVCACAAVSVFRRPLPLPEVAKAWEPNLVESLCDTHPTHTRIKIYRFTIHALRWVQPLLAPPVMIGGVHPMGVGIQMPVPPGAVHGQPSAARVRTRRRGWDGIWGWGCGGT